MEKETLFQNKVKADLEALPYTFVIKIQQQALRGDPDLVVCIGGRAVYLELKKDEKSKADALQLYRLHKARKANALAFVVWPEIWGELLDYLEELASWPISQKELPKCLRSHMAGLETQS